MNYPANTKDSANSPHHIRNIGLPIQAYAGTDETKRNVNLETSIIDQEEKLRVVKGILFALILCIPFWILVIMFGFWLF